MFFESYKNTDTSSNRRSFPVTYTHLMHQAAAEIENLKQQAIAEIQNARQQAVEEGRKQGYQEGLEQGHQDGYALSLIHI